MKTLKNLHLPKWIIKRICFGKEHDDLGFLLVNLGAFYILGIMATFAYSPLSTQKNILCLIAVLTIIILFADWITYQISLLSLLRRRLKIAFKNAKTTEEVEKAKAKAKILCISL